MASARDSATPKRSDVGYKRPPAEHQFQKGGKAPPRKKRIEPDFDSTALFWRVLQEPRRVTIAGKLKWVTAAELVVRKAFHEAEKGSSTLQRLLNGLLLDGNASAEEPLLVCQPDHPTSEIITLEVPLSMDVATALESLENDL